MIREPRYILVDVPPSLAQRAEREDLSIARVVLQEQQEGSDTWPCLFCGVTFKGEDNARTHRCLYYEKNPP